MRLKKKIRRLIIRKLQAECIILELKGIAWGLQRAKDKLEEKEKQEEKKDDTTKI